MLVKGGDTTQATQELNGVEVAHVGVHHDQVELPQPEYLECLKAIGNHGRPESTQGQAFSEELREIRVVRYDEDMWPLVGLPGFEPGSWRIGTHHASGGFEMTCPGDRAARRTMRVAT